MNRIAFVVDGFNLYHSLNDAARDLGKIGAANQTKWLDLESLLSSYLPNISTDAKLERIIYFSALAHFRNKKDSMVTIRHQKYISCLKAQGIEVVLGRFKNTQIHCKQCGLNFQKPEEKETDVSLALKILELFVTDAADTVVIVSGDTDFLPAITTSRRLYPNAKILCMQPYKRKNDELKKYADHSFVLKRELYTKHQLPDPFMLSNGVKIDKPLKW